jgi:hypothetical protein
MVPSMMKRRPMAHDGLPTSALAHLVERSPRATRTRVAALVERGLIIEVGRGANDPQRRYYRSQTP